MERLTRLLLLACLCLLTSRSDAQQVTQDSYLLAGDVQTPQVHPYPVGTQMTVQGLLMAARQSGVQGTATVLRGQPLTVAATELCPPTNATSNPLMPGDIVIFRALQGWNGQQNVIRVSSSSVDVLPLTGPLAAGQLTAGGAAPVTAFRTEFGHSTKLTLTAGDIVQHGDVVVLESPVLAQPATPGTATPGTATPPMTSLPETGGLNVSPASSPSSIEGSNFLTIPGMSADTGDIRSVSAPAEPTAETPFDVSPFDLEPPVMDAEQPVSPVASVPSPDESITALTETETPEQGTASAESLWNALFVLGIALALGLITIGWVKTQQEQRLEQEAAAGIKDGLAESRFASRQTNESLPQDSSPIESLSIASQPAMDSPAAAAVADSPDERSEFELSAFISMPPAEASAPPQQKSNEQLDEDCPVLSAGIEQSAAGGVDSAESSDSSNSVAPGDHRLQSMAAAAASAAPLVAPTEWFGEDWRKPIIEEPEELVAQREMPADAKTDVDADAPAAAAAIAEQETTLRAAESEVDSVAAENVVASSEDDVDDTEVEILRQRNAAPPADVLASFPQPAVPGYSEPQPVSQERQDVEDLIENRIPVNLQQASLPLSVSLYGKPSGPKRLRIDAAHTEIAPPHMMSRSRRGKRPAQSVASAAATAKPADSAETAGLDKALNYIDEQLDK